MSLDAKIQQDGIDIINGKECLRYKLTFVDDAQVVIEQVISEPFLDKETEEIRAGRYLKQFQETIDNYKNKKLIEESQQIVIDNTATKIKNALVI